MINPRIPDNEKERLENLHSYTILDTLPEKEYDDITLIASQICKTPISLISLIDEKRQWFKSKHGLNTNETPKEFAFCAHAINQPSETLVVQDSRLDARFKNNPLVTGDPYVIFYAGIPLVTPEGYPLGTLCVIDNQPKELDESQINSLKALANQVIKLMELRLSLTELSNSEKKLKDINSAKDKLFSIIGHDLRGSIGSIKSLVDLLNKEFKKSDKKLINNILDLTQKAANSTNDLLENLLEWARSQQNQIVYAPTPVNLNEILSKTIELFSEIILKKKISIIDKLPNNEVVFADKNMLLTIFRNIISNAIKFSPIGKKIQISIEKNDNEHIITVKDEGAGISTENLHKLFRNDEFLTTTGTNGEKGSGLGLLLCKDLVEKHNGKIWIESGSNIGSSIKFTLPKF